MSVFSLNSAADVSDDFQSFGLLPIYASLDLSPARRWMVQQLPGQLPAPADFTVADPSHVAALALLGLLIFPTEKADIHRAVADQGSFSKLVKNRVEEMRQGLEAARPDLLCMGMTLFESPEPRKSNELATDHRIPRELIPSWIAAALDRLDYESAYFGMSREARLNRYAIEYGHGDIGKLLRFVDKVSDILKCWGLGDYPTVAKPDRFIKHLLSTTPANDVNKKALEDLHAHRAVLRRRTAGEIWLFVCSRAERLDGVTFEIEDDELTVICSVGRTKYRERLVDRHLDGSEMFSNNFTIQA